MMTLTHSSSLPSLHPQDIVPDTVSREAGRTDTHLAGLLSRMDESGEYFLLTLNSVSVSLSLNVGNG